MSEEPRLPEQKESIKLTKNAKGDYQWEIKILRGEVQSIDSWFDDVRSVNDKLKSEYGSKE